MFNFKEKYRLGLQFFSEPIPENNNNSSDSNDMSSKNIYNDPDFEMSSKDVYTEPNFEIDENYDEFDFETGEAIIKRENEPASKKILSSIFDLVEIFAYAIAMMVIVFLFVFKFVTVDGSSMQNTLEHKDRLIVYNLFYTPELNDIIIINYDEKDELLVKRVIGTEGDKVKINFETWEIWVNDELLPQPYIEDNIDKLRGNKMSSSGDYISKTVKVDESFCSEFVVEEGKVFVLGDNRNNSLDSRAIGQLDVDEILGKVVLRIAPFDNMGKVE